MEPRPPIIVITGRQRPHLLFMMGYSILFGLLVLAGPGSNPVLQELDPAARIAWAVSLGGSGLLSVVGCFWRGNVQRALSLERAGMLFNAMSIMIFAAFVYQYSANRAIFTSGICLAWAAANVYRAAQISKDLRSLRGALNGAAT